MDFVSWLDENVLHDKRQEGFDKSTQTAMLWDESDDVRLEVRKILGPGVILLPEKIQQWRILRHRREKQWGSRCDFLMVGESSGQCYAIFLEFKRSIRSLEEEEQEARRQLKWSTSILHYLLSVFNLDLASSLTEEDLEVRHIVIGKKFSKRFDKQPIRTDPQSPFHFDDYDGLKIHYVLNWPITLRQLLNRSAVEPKASP